MRGQVEFFDAERKSGFIISESREKLFFSGRHWLGDIAVIRNQWVEFRIATRSDGKSRSAIDVFPIACPEEYLLYGTVKEFFPVKNFGFISYSDAEGQTQSVFFHCSDLLRIDGVEPAPCVGCRVSFCLGQKTDREIASQIWIEQWPANYENVEKYFEEAPELPIDVPEPVAAAPQGSVLAPKLRGLPLIEIIRLQREERRA